MGKLAETIGDAAWLQRPHTQEILALLNTDGAITRAVGGCVRDTLLGCATKDTEIDLATNLVPDEMISRLQKAGVKTVPTGIEHGTVTAVLRGPNGTKSTFEVTTLRTDIVSYGRFAEVVFSQDWHGDAARRDLTINALYCDSDGTIYDPTGQGLKDLENLRVRFIGEAAQRIKEDYLRVLRFFRFHFTLAAKDPIDSAALAASTAAAPHLGGLSGERKLSEMLKILALPSAGDALQAMSDGQLLPSIFGCEAAFQLARLQAMGPQPKDRLLALMALFPDLETALIAAKSLRLSGKQLARIQAAFSPSAHLKAGDIRAALYFDGVACLQDKAALAIADEIVGEMAGTQKPETAFWTKVLAAVEGFEKPVFPLSGAMMMRAGMEPGPAMGRMAHDVEIWWVGENFPGADAVEAELISRLASA